MTRSHTKECIDFVDNSLYATINHIECICNRKKKELDEIMEFNLYGSISYQELRNRLSEVEK